LIISVVMAGVAYSGAFEGDPGFQELWKPATPGVEAPSCP
jgi:hypothetical protein